MMLLNEEWTFPELSTGDVVEFARNPESMGKACPGNVTAVYSNPESNSHAIDIQVIRGGGHRFYRAVHHIDDPALKEHPEWLKEPSSGVFRVARATLAPKENAVAIASLKRRVKSLEDRLERMGDKIEKLEAKRKPGRPPKSESEPAEMATA